MITRHLTTNRASRNHFFAIIFHDYLHYCGIFLATFLIIFLKHNFKPSYSLLALCISWLVWCLYRIYQLNMSPLNIKHVQYLRNNWQLCMSCVYFVKKKKCGLRLRLFLWFDIFSTFRGVHPLIFTYVPYIVIGLHEELANFYRKKQSIAFATGHLITFLVVLFLICLVATQILTIKNNCCGFIRNQMQWPVC